MANWRQKCILSQVNSSCHRSSSLLPPSLWPLSAWLLDYSHNIVCVNSFNFILVSLFVFNKKNHNSCPADLKKPTDLDLHCLSLSMWIYSNNPDQVIWLAENWKWAWHLNLFSRTRVNTLENLCFAVHLSMVSGQLKLFTDFGMWTAQIIYRFWYNNIYILDEVLDQTNFIPLGKIRKIFKIFYADFFTQHGEC